MKNIKNEFSKRPSELFKSSKCGIHLFRQPEDLAYFKFCHEGNKTLDLFYFINEIDYKDYNIS